MELGATHTNLSKLTRQVVWADAALELVIAVVLTGVAWRVHAWLDVGRPVALIAAVVFAIAAVAVAWLAWSPKTKPELVRYPAFGNIAGGAAVWAVALSHWDSFQPEGRWLVSAAADAFILIGVLELLALWRQPREG